MHAFVEQKFIFVQVLMKLKIIRATSRCSKSRVLNETKSRRINRAKSGAKEIGIDQINLFKIKTNDKVGFYF